MIMRLTIKAIMYAGYWPSFDKLEKIKYGKKMVKRILETERPANHFGKTQK